MLATVVLSTYISLSLPNFVSFSLFLPPCLYVYACLHMCMSVSFSLYVCLYVSVWLSLSLSLCFCFSAFIYLSSLSLSLSVCRLYVRASLCLSISSCLSVSRFLSLSLSVCLSLRVIFITISPLQCFNVWCLLLKRISSFTISEPGKSTTVVRWVGPRSSSPSCWPSLHLRAPSKAVKSASTNAVASIECWKAWSCTATEAEWNNGYPSTWCKTRSTYPCPTSTSLVRCPAPTSRG